MDLHNVVLSASHKRFDKPDTAGGVQLISYVDGSSLILALVYNSPGVQISHTS